MFHPLIYKRVLCNNNYNVTNNANLVLHCTDGPSTVEASKQKQNPHKIPSLEK